MTRTTTQLTIILYRGKGAQPYRWRLRAPNGRTLADSAEGYATANSARRAVMKLGEWAVKGILVEDALTPAPRSAPKPPKGSTWAESASYAYTAIHDWIVKEWRAPSAMPKG